MSWRAQVSGSAIEWIAWLALVATLALAKSFIPESQTLNIAVGIFSVGFGLRVFYGHGQTYVTVLGLFSFALGLFVGFAGAYVALVNDPRVSPGHLGVAILAGFALQVLTVSVGWRGKRSAPPQFPKREVSNWLARWSSALLVVLIFAGVLGVAPEVRGLVESAAFAATTALAVGLLYRTDVRIGSWQTVTVLAAVGVYVEIFHTGGGRLRVVALLGAISIIATMAWPRRVLKRIILLATPAALYLLAQYRLDYQESVAYGASSGRTGLESMMVPIVALGRMVQAQGEGLQLAWGWNLLSFPLSFLPEGWMANAPQALGYEIVEFYSPDRYGSGYSLAATATGEAIYNFGLAGILIAAPILAWLCNLVDRRFRIAAAEAHTDRVALVRLAAWATVGGAIADLAWNGWHVFIVRTLTRLPLFAVLAALAIVSRSRAHSVAGRDERSRASATRYASIRNRRHHGGEMRQNATGSTLRAHIPDRPCPALRPGRLPH